MIDKMGWKCPKAPRWFRADDEWVVQVYIFASSLVLCLPVLSQVQRGSGPGAGFQGGPGS